MTPSVTHPLFALIPADQLFGDLIEVIEVGDGIVTVVATPDSEWATHQITSWRHLDRWEIDRARADFPGEPVTEAMYVTASRLQDEAKIASEVAEASTSLTRFLSRRNVTVAA
ncbi:hypothetical protein [Streptomyces microflavus]|uniref:hypothetical protein n=1 Tax=Streptomyces microflavus TaxID=1919 RepID=UPI002E2FB1F2|nr:hypothetical protein [Streptomyces microflavus]